MRILLFTLTVWPLAADPISYPKTRKVDHTETYHGTRVADPYRWLEDDRSAETAAWVKAQNEITFGYLGRIGFRDALAQRLASITDYETRSAPIRRGDVHFFSRNAGLQDQSVWYVQKGSSPPEVLIDPNTFSADGASPLRNFSVSRDGRYVVFGKSTGGSDWQEYRVMELATRKLLPETLRWIKNSNPSWRGSGFFYSRYPAPESGRELVAKNEFQAVYYHRVGTPQSEDLPVYEDREHPQRFHAVFTTEDERFALLRISERGRAATGSAIFWRDETKGEKEFRPLFPEITDTSHRIIDHAGGKFLVQTNHKAPNSRVVLVDPARPAESNWTTVIPEDSVPLGNVSATGGKLFARYLKDVSAVVRIYTPGGKHEGDVALPGPGTVSGFGGLAEDTDTFYTFTSFLSPGAIYRYELGSGKSTLFWRPKLDFDFSRYVTEKVFFPSKDGTHVPMFLTHRKDLVKDGRNPTLMYGYGGFSLSRLPDFSAERLALLEQGVIYASVCMRGGLEYGEEWHRAGMRDKKQNVFDDFIAAGEYLVREKYTSASRLACQGGSNGGLLVGAVINQRPDLFRAAIPQVGVMDMLRFHKFTIGWNWVAEYGSADVAADFPHLYAYSPLHNIRQGGKYPSVLVTTSDHDDRVVPAHSFKYAAALQEKAAPGNPVLIRIETMSGHGASSTSKRRSITADIYSFLLHELGVVPKMRAPSRK
jgi:prolyl oligopeptidase